MTGEEATTQITGHRGARGLWPENSLEGFGRVGALGVDAVEFDVHRTDAGELVVLHDPWLERTTDGSGPVRALTPERRRQLRLASSAEMIPTLAEVLDVLAGEAAALHVELKNDETGAPYPGLVADVLAEIDRRDLRSRCHLASFDVTVLAACRQAAPDVGRLVSVDASWLERQGGLHRFLDVVDDLAEIVALHHAVLSEQWSTITRRIARERLCVWTVNDADEISDWYARGVGHLTSDRPDLALRLRPASSAPGLGPAT
jgi:glycerophosphoryl diester phosphodiesterase